MQRRGILLSFAALGAMALTGCATAAATDSVSAQRVLSRQEGALVLNIEWPGQFEWALFKFRNLQTGRIYFGTANRRATPLMPVAPAITSLPPGRYVISHVSLTSGGSIFYETSLTQLWFRPFEIHGGELVDLGSLEFSRTTAEAAVDALFRSGDKPLEYLFIEFAVHRRDEENAASVAKFIPELSDLVVPGHLDEAITHDQFVELIRAAYEPGPDGAPVRREIAEARLTEGMRSLLAPPQ